MMESFLTYLLMILTQIKSAGISLRRVEAWIDQAGEEAA
jgi:hypothetical protein